MSGDNPHDSLFRFVFTRLETASAHFQTQLPEAVVQAVRWETLEQQPGSFVDPELQQLHSDLLYRVRLKEKGELYLYVLLEHQSRPDPLMPYRLLVYMGRIWQRWLDETKEQLPLPFLLPMVLYNGERRWNVTRQFEGLLPERLRPELAAFVPDFTYLLQDLGRTPDEELRGEVLGRLTLVWLKHGHERAFLERLPEYFETLAQVLARPDGLGAIEALMRYLFFVSPREMPEEIRVRLVQALTPETERWWMTWAEQLENEALERGRKEEQARMLKKQRQQMLLMLQRRFGVLPEDAVRTVEEAPEEALDRWMAGLLDAASVEELLRTG